MQLQIYEKKLKKTQNYKKNVLDQLGYTGTMMKKNLMAILCIKGSKQE